MTADILLPYRPTHKMLSFGTKIHLTAKQQFNVAENDLSLSWPASVILEESPFAVVQSFQTSNLLPN